ncbi:hypothetical protein L1887_48249 [Cichorium endivia]|nr:hypothetical protein L1887_48249 [Cichorium endivia]
MQFFAPCGLARFEMDSHSHVTLDNGSSPPRLNLSCAWQPQSRSARRARTCRSPMVKSIQASGFHLWPRLQRPSNTVLGGWNGQDNKRLALLGVGGSCVFIVVRVGVGTLAVGAGLARSGGWLTVGAVPLAFGDLGELGREAVEVPWVFALFALEQRIVLAALALLAPADHAHLLARHHLGPAWQLAVALAHVARQVERGVLRRRNVEDGDAVQRLAPKRLGGRPWLALAQAELATVGVLAPADVHRRAVLSLQRSLLDGGTEERDAAEARVGDLDAHHVRKVLERHEALACGTVAGGLPLARDPEHALSVDDCRVGGTGVDGLCAHQDVFARKLRHQCGRQLVLLRAKAETAVAAKAPDVDVALVVESDGVLLPTRDAGDVLVRELLDQEGLGKRVESKAVVGSEVLARSAVAELTLFGRAHGVELAGLCEEHGEGEAARCGDDGIALLDEGTRLDARKEGHGLRLWVATLARGVEAGRVDGASCGDEERVPDGYARGFGGSGDGADGKTALPMLVAADNDVRCWQVRAAKWNEEANEIQSFELDVRREEEGEREREAAYWSGLTLSGGPFLVALRPRVGQSMPPVTSTLPHCGSSTLLDLDISMRYAVGR